MTWLLLLGATHVRAVAEQPTSLDALEERSVRAWWNGGPASVEVDRGRGWQDLGSLESGALLGSAQRVRVDGQEVPVTLGLDPSGVARLFDPDALPGREVADITATPDGAWAALLDGGVVRLNKDDLVVESYGVAEGLPSVQVNAVAGGWAGTASGLFEFETGRVWSMDEGLPDDWVQALYAHSDGLYVGTFTGLALLTDRLTRVLGPASVFWIGEGGDARRWVGYQGLLGLPDAEPIEGVDPALNVWDVDHVPGEHWLATDTEGLLLLREGVLSPVYSPASGAVYALHRQQDTLYAAANDGGLVALKDRQPIRRWGRADGLPSDTVYEVEGGPQGKLWVGTADGLALMWPRQDVVVPWPRSPVAAGVPVYDVLGTDDYVLAATDEGVATLGKVPRGWRDVEALPGPIVALEAHQRRLWVIGARTLWFLERGRVHRVPLPVEAHHAAWVGGNLWVGGPEGVFRYDAGADRMVPGPRCDQVLALEAGPSGLLWVVTPHRVLAVDRSGAARDYVTASPARDVAVVGEQVYLATRNGLEVMNARTGDVSTVAGFTRPMLEIEVEGTLLWTVDEDLNVRTAPSGLPRPGVAELWTLGAVHRLVRDGHGRIWLMGERGMALL